MFEKLTAIELLSFNGTSLCEIENSKNYSCVFSKNLHFNFSNLICG